MCSCWGECYCGPWELFFPNNNIRGTVIVYTIISPTYLYQMQAYWTLNSLQKNSYWGDHWHCSQCLEHCVSLKSSKQSQFPLSIEQIAISQATEVLKDMIHCCSMWARKAIQCDPTLRLVGYLSIRLLVFTMVHTSAIMYSGSHL